MGNPAEGPAAMVTQFRDFISGAVGFLTGCASRGSGTTPD